MQHDAPTPELEPNWLPCPAGPFGLTFRTYLPGPAIRDGSLDRAAGTRHGAMLRRSRLDETASSFLDADPVAIGVALSPAPSSS